MKKIILLICFITSSCSGTDNEKVYHHPQKNELVLNIEQMMIQTIDPFLILEEKKTKKFIQFYNEEGMIFIDLPQIALNETEIVKANIYFNNFGIKLSKNVATSVETMNELEIKTWSKVYSSQDSDQVSNIAIGAMYKIYDFSDSNEFLLIKGWE